MDSKRALAENLRKNIYDLNMTQAKYAKEIGIPITTLQYAGLKSIFETDFKGHSEPRLPSTAQINHQLRLITYLNPGKH